MPRHGHLVGHPCPAFAVTDTHGDTLREADLVGHPALIVFYPFAFTGICQAELAELDTRVEEFDDVAILAISCDPVASARAWQEQQGFAFEVASDFWPHGDASRAFGVFDERTGHARRGSFIIDAEGRVQWSVINPAGTGRPVQAYLDALTPLRVGQ